MGLWMGLYVFNVQAEPSSLFTLSKVQLTIDRWEEPPFLKTYTLSAKVEDFDGASCKVKAKWRYNPSKLEGQRWVQKPAQDQVCELPFEVKVKALIDPELDIVTITIQSANEVHKTYELDPLDLVYYD